MRDCRPTACDSEVCGSTCKHLTGMICTYNSLYVDKQHRSKVQDNSTLDLRALGEAGSLFADKN
jgi:hypothetical protein